LRIHEGGEHENVYGPRREMQTRSRVQKDVHGADAYRLPHPHVELLLQEVQENL